MMKFINVSIALFLLCSIGTAQDTSKKKSSSGKVFFGIASFYSDSFDGGKTATGERFRQKGFTGASNNVPLNTWVRVTNLRNNKSVVVKINDRMAPRMAKKGRVVDLTRAAATQLSFVAAGLVKVKMEVLGKKKPL